MNFALDLSYEKSNINNNDPFSDFKMTFPFENNEENFITRNLFF